MFRHRVRCFSVLLFGVLSFSAWSTLPAGDSAPPKSFEAIRQRHAKAAFEEVAAYLADHAEADDAEEAYRYLFETALEHDMVVDALPAARTFLADRPEASPGDRLLARRVAMLALGQQGEADAAIELFGEELAALRRLDPSLAIDSAILLAGAVQRGGKPEAAREVYQRLQRTFLLNTGVDLIATNRLKRLELLGEVAPEITLNDLNGQAVSANDLTGKIVLVDFWATNCPPCLEELPQLKRLQTDFKPLGFEILAISLDDESETVREYVERTSLPWRVFVSVADDHATREGYHVETIPANFLIGRDGKIVRVDLHGADLRAEVERLLKDGAAKGR